MKKKTILVSMLLLAIFVMQPNAEAQGPILEFIDAPDRIKLEDVFTFSVRLTNAQGYDYFSLYGETPSGEEMYFGERFFDTVMGDWPVYSDRWTLTFVSFNETGYYTVYVDAGAVNSPDVDIITTSFSVYVEEGKTDPTLLDYFMLLCPPFGLILILSIGVVYAIRRRGGKEEVVQNFVAKGWWSGIMAIVHNGSVRADSDALLSNKSTLIDAC